MKKVKRLSILMLCLLAWTFVFSEENETSFLAVSRVDANPYMGNGLSFDWGNTSLYTLFEGGLGECFSYSVANHWLSSDPAPLYANTFRTDDVNWLDWANITAYLGNFDMTAGKQSILLGSWEQDGYDYDACLNLGSSFWNNLQTYTWGLALGYTTPSENTYLSLQMNTSPFGEYNNSGLFSYAFYLNGEYGCYRPIWSLNVMEYEEETYSHKGCIYVIALGNGLSFDALDIAFDWVARSYSLNNIFREEMSMVASATYTFNDGFDLMLKGGWEFNQSGEDVFGYEDEPGFVPASLASMGRDYFFAGMQVNYYPLEDSEKLRIHGAVAANNYANSLSFTIGATYFLDLFDL